MFCLIISAINQNNIYLPITELRKIHLSLLPVATFLTVINKMIRNPYFWMAFTPVFSPAQCPSWWKLAWKLEQILHVLTGNTEGSGSAPVHQIWAASGALSLDFSSLPLECGLSSVLHVVLQFISLLTSFCSWCNKWVSARRHPLLTHEMPLNCSLLPVFHLSVASNLYLLHSLKKSQSVWCSTHAASFRSRN